MNSHQVNLGSDSVTTESLAEACEIGRVGTFLYQLDAEGKLNLWSGRLDANNGYPKEHAERAAKLFQAAPELLEAAEEALVELLRVSPSRASPKLRAAIAKATGA